MKANTIIEAVIGLVVGLALLPIINSMANNMTQSNVSTRCTGVTCTLINLVPTIYVIILVAGAAAYVYYKR